MCGLAGIVSDNPIDRGRLESSIEQMSDTLSHRGPDDSGAWVDPEQGVAFSHRRLSINDLSQSGQQPMRSACGRFIISYNGEVYNFSSLRRELEKQDQQFRGNSDTEVALAAISIWGLEVALQRFIGMFAFALWDRQSGTLQLVRDRLGIKPLYWGRFGGLFLFGSELKSLRAHPSFNANINRDALSAYMRHNYVPAPHTIYEGIFKLQPGTVLTYKVGTEPTLSKYWITGDTVVNGLRNRSDANMDELTKSTESILEDSVKLRMISDVPLGAFLSGGIDSSAVVSLMQKNSSQPIKTFSIGFNEQDYNEAVYAKEVAKHLGTDHTEFYLSPKDCLNVIPLLPKIYDEPFADSSQIPTFLISRLTRQHVTVALTGDGGDEVFAGYNRYIAAEVIIKKMGLMNKSSQKLMRNIIHMLPPNHWTRVFGLLPRKYKIPQGGDKLYKLAKMLTQTETTAYRNLVSHWDNPEELVLNSKEPDSALNNDPYIESIDSFLERMQYLDTITYLPDDILTKVDRASMAVSLEARIPLLDHRLVEHAWTFPLSAKIHNGLGKAVVRQILQKYVPREMMERPKMGFAMPIDSWLRGPLREWAEHLLDEQKILEGGYLNFGPINRKWREHLSGKRNWQHQLWNVLIFQAWYEHWVRN